MDPKDSNVQLLDCTLRDGSYANNFQFTARDTRNICKGLERAGITHIEVGHGLGLGASSPRNGVAFESDNDYIEAAASVVSSAQIGAFYIPGIGLTDRLEDAARAGLDFIRIGANATDIASTISHVEAALSLGLDVHLNLMKTYAVPPSEILRQLRSVSDLDIASVYIVDSAGCMLPNHVNEYVEALRSEDWIVGFHGHNNLDLANANCLASLESGAQFVDASLCGMGRSAGNAQTEVLCWLMAKAGYKINVDPFVLFNLVEKIIKPLMIHPQGRSVLEVVTGMSRFHSGFLPRFKRATNEYDVDIYRLIQTVSQVDCVDPSEELIWSIAKDMNRTSR